MTKLKIGLAALAFAFALWFATHTSAAPGFNIAGEPFYVITVPTGSPVTVTLPSHDTQIVHLGVQSDGITASATGSYIVVMHAGDTMSANLSSGRKLPIFSGGSATFRGVDCSYVQADNAHEIQIQAVGTGGAQVLILKGNLYGSGR